MSTLSLYGTNGDRYRILFYPVEDGAPRRTVYLGKCSKRHALTVQGHIDAILVARSSG